MAWFHSISNDVFFKIRRSLPNLRGRYREQLDSFSLADSQSYFSMRLAGDLSERRLRVALFYSWILDQIPGISFDRKLKAIDLGSKDFAYAPALCRYLDGIGDGFELRGLEADPFVFYADLFRRGQAADYIVKLCEKEWPESSISYGHGNWLELSGADYDFVFCFFPFLFDDLHQDFRLPSDYFAPEDFYRKIFRSTGRSIFFHQGDLEQKESLRLIEKIGGTQLVFQGSFQDNPWLPRKFPVHVLILESVDRLNQLNDGIL